MDYLLWKIEVWKNSGFYFIYHPALGLDGFLLDFGLDQTLRDCQFELIPVQLFELPICGNPYIQK